MIFNHRILVLDSTVWVSAKFTLLNKKVGVSHLVCSHISCFAITSCKTVAVDVTSRNKTCCHIVENVNISLKKFYNEGL